ncbi:MAG: SDR family oxidoreductase, partial [Candidatus Poribacteria bacterium]|nr:SDR family oxidoreductase [Candidatus Poribacteria bacterium]
MKSFKGATVLITGASSGIGEAFARNLANRGANLILTARSGDKLRQIAGELSEKHAIDAHVFPGDLSRPDMPQRLFIQIQFAGLPVDVLINNAGFGKWGHFLDVNYQRYQDMLNLNINALVSLTHLLLPAMLKRGDGGIINVASTAAFQPLPYVATYSATKAFVLSFSEALWGEYREHGLTILALCPGNTSTHFADVANADDTKMQKAETPDKVAEVGLEAFLRGRNYVIPGTPT